MATGWLRGRVKAVTSGDCLVIMGNVKSGPPPEKTITLASLMAPKLARRDTQDEPFAWESREFLRKKCIGQEVVFKVEYVVPSINREFGNVFMGDTNLALAVVTAGWAKVRPPVPNSTDVSPYLEQLQKAEEQAKEQGLGMWNKTPGAAEAAIRDLPPSGVGQDTAGFDAQELLDKNKGLTLAAIVEQVRDGSTVRVFLLPSFQYVQVYVAGVQSPSVGRRLVDVSATVAPAAEEAAAPTEAEAANGTTAAAGADGAAAPSAAQRLAASTAAAEGAAEPFALEAKHFTEVRCLHREVRVVLEGVDGKFSNLVGSVHYPEGDSVRNLALELVQLGMARVVEWSANMLEPTAKSALKAAELEAKKQRIRMWTNFVPPPSNSTAVRDDNFKGTVVEVVSGDCLIVADDSAPAGSGMAAERRVNLSSIRARKMGNPRRDERPESYAREAKEFLRQRLIGQQVSVTMEYTRKMPPSEEGGAEGRAMTFGTVMLLNPSKDSADGAPAAAAGSAAANGGSGGAPGPLNVAELVVGRGFATVVRHRDFEERSSQYDTLLAAEARAVKGKRNIHSSKEPPVAHVNDLSLPGTTNKARGFLPFLQRAKRMAAVVDYVLSGHRYKLVIPRESCAIAFSLSGVRCPGRGEPFSEEAIAFMRRRIMQHDVEIEVETVDKTGTFIGSLWVHPTGAHAHHQRSNAGVLLLEAGLAKLHPSFAADRTAEGAQLVAAEKRAKAARVGVWHDYVEGQEAKAEEGGNLAASAVAGGGAWGKAKQEVVEVQVTEVLGGGRFYVVEAGNSPQLTRLEMALKDLSLANVAPPALGGTFVPKRGDIVLAQFSADDSWARAMVVAAPPDASPNKNSEYTVFYIDYGNQETNTYSRLRPLDASVSAAAPVSSRSDAPGLAQLCQLAHVKVPGAEDDFGEEAAQYLQSLVAGSGTGGKKLVARIEQRDTSGGRAKGQNTGTCWIVTLVDSSSTTSINAAMLQAGFARLEKRSNRDLRNTTLSAALDSLRDHQEIARKARLNIWQYGDVDSDEEDDVRGGGRGGAGRGGGRR